MKKMILMVLLLCQGDITHASPPKSISEDTLNVFTVEGKKKQGRTYTIKDIPDDFLGSAYRQASSSQGGVAPVSGMKGLNSSKQDASWDDIFIGAQNQATPFTGPMGHILPKEFGESKYDKDIAISEVLEGKDLNQLRARAKSADTQEHIQIFLNILGVFSCVIIVLIAFVRLLKKFD